MTGGGGGGGHSLLWSHYHRGFLIYVVDMLNLQMKRNVANMEKQQNTGCSTEIVHLYHDLSRSVRESDLDLFIHTIPKISCFFFAFNQPNYAKWMVQHHNNFSRSPINLTLEQTVNADAASLRTGIGAFTNSISARQRWSHSHYISVIVITHLLDDVTRELKASRISKNSTDLCKLMNVISETVDPFPLHNEKEFLFNIATGKSASAEITAFLLGASRTGCGFQKEFIDECVAI